MTIQPQASTEVQKPSLARAFILSALLVTVDAFWLNQGAIAMLVGLGLLLVSLPRTFLRKFALVRSQRLRNVGIYLSAVALVFGLNALNNRLAQSRADFLIAAVNLFHSEHHGYPQSLEELVPRYIDEVPLAKYTLVFNQFRYARAEQDTYLEYMEIPPFGRLIYSFQKGERYYLD